MIYIVGGVMNSNLETWLRHLRINDYCHITINTEDISPSVMRRTAERVLNEIRGAHGIISVGHIADKLLTSVHVIHCSLPASTLKDKKVISKCLESCMTYLYQRSLYAVLPPNSIS